MTHKTISIYTAILLSIVFFIFIMAYEKRTVSMATARIATHARIIEDAMWNYNHPGVQEYLTLAAFSDRYESLTAFHQNGDIFQKIKASRLRVLTGC